MSMFAKGDFKIKDSWQTKDQEAEADLNPQQKK